MRPDKPLARRRRQARCLQAYRQSVWGDPELPFPVESVDGSGGDSDRLRTALVAHAAQTRRGAVMDPTPCSDNLEIVACCSEYDPRTMITDAKVELRVAGDNFFKLEELMPVLDPRRWAELCREEGWTLSDEVKVGPHGALLPVRDGEPFTRGWEGRLHEIFEVNWNEQLYTFCRFDVILNVFYRRGDLLGGDAILFAYDLHAPIECKMFHRVQPGGLDVDSGLLVVTRDRVIATKKVRFSQLCPPGGSALIPAFASSPLNVTAPALVSFGLHEGLLKAFEPYFHCKKPHDLGSPEETPHAR